jgi:hypothetical protein
MKSVKFYDRFSIITIFLAILFIIYELIWILNPEVNQIISSQLNLIIAMPIIITYAVYHSMISGIAYKLSYLEHTLILFRFTLAPVSYFGKLRKLLKKYHSENNNIYNN